MFLPFHSFICAFTISRFQSSISSCTKLPQLLRKAESKSIISSQHCCLSISNTFWRHTSTNTTQSISEYDSASENFPHVLPERLPSLRLWAPDEDSCNMVPYSYIPPRSMYFCRGQYDRLRPSDNSNMRKQSARLGSCPCSVADLD